MATDTPIRIGTTAALLIAAACFASSARPAGPRTTHTTCGTTRTALVAADSATVADVKSRGHAADLRPAYGWPVKPFDRQHPLRGFLDDPRIGGHSKAFHFGIDVAAPDGTAVYAVAGGEIFFDSAQSIAVKTGPNHEFGYWHVVPTVKPHQIVHTHELLGHIGPGWGHVHFAERIGGVYVNPIRPGGLGPYTDPLPPTVSSVDFTPIGGGAFDIVTSAYDTTWPPVPGAWANEPVTPALVQWRIVRRGGTAGSWHTAADFRDHMLDKSLFGTVYAPETTQNHMGVAARYCFYLARGWKPADGSYRVEVAAFDTRGNSAVAHLDVAVSRGKISESEGI
jgi:Peptidase family M23